MLSRGIYSRILNLECSRVTKGYERLEHRTSLLVTREIMQARATLHLSGTVTTNKESIVRKLCHGLLKAFGRRKC